MGLFRAITCDDNGLIYIMTEPFPVLFLFNHDAAHQVAHSAGLAGATALMMAEQNDKRGVIVATSGPHIRREIERLLTAEQIAALKWRDLSLPRWLNFLLAPLNEFAPARRFATLYWHRRTLRRAALIVSTERTCLTLKRHWRSGKGPRFAYVPHGSGDRNVAVHPALKDFDLCLVSGQKVVDQLVTAGVATPEKCRIVGYTKFDILRHRQPEVFFNNGRPAFLYNPHFDPHMSSWFDQGNAVLRFFYDRPDQFNLIFAPHVMLFKKKVHISPEFKVTKTRPDIAPEFRSAPNILIDVDGPRLFDMSYTCAADAYIGDVSSQIYEFLSRPRACFFLDVHSGSTLQDTPAYDFWNNGPVLESTEQFDALLPQYQAIAEQYRAAQTERMAYTADNSSPFPASERGAMAILDYLRSLPSASQL